MIRRIAQFAATLIIFALAVWWLIGPDWRAFLSNPPTEGDVLFWSQDQRDTGFRMMDRVPFIIESRQIASGSEIYPLPNGAPLNVSLDIDAYMDEHRVAGIVIVHNGEVRHEQYGLGFEDDGRWTSFSVAKSMTSSLVGAAIRDGHIASLDNKVSDYVEGLQGSAYDDVTVAQLLTMTSGVGWNEDYEDPTSDVAQFLSHAPEGDTPIIVDYMRGLERAHPPGEVWNYSTGETNLIGILVSEATGKPLADYLSEKIWAPFGMQQNASWLIGEDDLEVSGCCVQASIRDFARYGLFMLGGGEIDGESIFPDGWLSSATQAQTGIGSPGFGYGYQWWTQDDGTYQARGIFGQGIFIDPTRNLVIAMNSSWSSATGVRGGERQAREVFYDAVQAAIDAEG